MSKIAVIGDTALDFSYFSHLSKEKSAETDLAVNYIDRIFYDAGGAGNLASNIVALGLEVDLFGLCGNDFWAELLIGKLKENGVGITHFHKSKKTETYVYHRIFDEFGNEMPRYDFGQGGSYDEQEILNLLNELEQSIASYSALIVNQQLTKSIHTPAFAERLNTILTNTDIPVWVDSRSGISYPGCSYKINLKEAITLTGKKKAEDCAKAIYTIYSHKREKEYVVVTRGENGAVAYDGKKLISCGGIDLGGQTDTIGCGDAFLAALCCELCTGKEIHAALNFANCAGALCSKFLHFCGHPKRKDVEALFEKVMFQPKKRNGLSVYLPQGTL